MKTMTRQQLLIILVPSIVVLLVMALVSVFFQVKIPVLTRDTTAIAKIHPLSGMLSNLGILLWCAAALISGFVAYVLRNIKTQDTFWFLFFSALLSAYLLLDDLFLFHEKIAPVYLGLPEKMVIGILGIAVLSYLIAFRRIILRTNFGVLLLALGFLATSVVIDSFFELLWTSQLDNWAYFFEDGTKWLGIASWCGYYVHTSHEFLVTTPGTEVIDLNP